MPNENVVLPPDLTHFRFVTKEPGVSPTDVYLDCHSRFSDGTPGDKYLGTIQQREGDRWTAGIYRGRQLWLCQILYLKWKTEEACRGGLPDVKGVYMPDAYIKDVADRFYGRPHPTVQEVYGTTDLLLLYDKGITKIQDDGTFSSVVGVRPSPTDIETKDATPPFVAHKEHEVTLRLPIVTDTDNDGHTHTVQATLKLGYALQFGPNEWGGHTQKIGSPIYTMGPYTTQAETIKALYTWHVEDRKVREACRIQAEGRTARPVGQKADTYDMPTGVKFDPTRTSRWLRERGFTGFEEAARITAEEARKLFSKQARKDLDALGLKRYIDWTDIGVDYAKGPAEAVVVTVSVQDGVTTILDVNTYVCTYAEGSAYKVGDVVEKVEKPSLAVRIDRGDFDDARLDATSSLNPFAAALVKEFDIPGDNRAQTNNLRWRLFKLAHTLVPREGKEVKTYLRALAAEYRRLRQVVIGGLGREDRRMGRGKE